MLCNFVVEISVGGLAWCLKQTQKHFFFKKNKGQECVCYQKNFGCLSIFTTRATAFFSKTMVYLSERKHPKLKTRSRKHTHHFIENTLNLKIR
jgi:hypothetical protein